MDANQHALGALLQVDPTDANAVTPALLSLLKRYLSAGQVDDLLQGRTSMVLSEDFTGVGATLADNPKLTFTQTGTPTVAAAVSATAGPSAIAGHRGWLSGATDDVDNEIDLIALGKKPWLKVSQIPAGMKARCEIGFSIPTALTARQYYFGWSDAETEATATNGPLNVQSALTVVDVADDAVGFIFSSLATAPTVFKYANTNAGTQMTNATTAGLTAVADQYIILAVEVDSGGNAQLYGNINATRGVTVPALIGSVASAVATTSLLIPIFSAAATTTTAVPYHIDYIRACIC